MIQIRAYKHYGRFDGVSFFVEEETNGRLFVGAPIVMKEHELFENDYSHGPTVQLSKHAAQKLIDDLWDCGLRPSEGSGSAGQLAATQKHLEDMRKLLSKVPLVKGSENG